MTDGSRSEKWAEDISGLQWRAVFDAVNDAVWLLDGDMRIIRSNRAAARIFERETDSILGKHCWEIVHGTQEPIAECPLVRMQASLQRESLELLIGQRFFEIIADPILDPQGRLVGAVHIVSDITGRKRHEIENTNLTRMYGTLSQINQTIVRAKSRQELFEGICQVAVEFGGVRLAWIGLLGPDGGEVGCVARAGEGSGYEEEVQIDLRDPGTRKGPAAGALASGEAAVAADIETDEDIAPWREKALRNGFRSGAAVPLRLNGEVIGVLSLYSEEAGFFAEWERQLLEEIGSDISFALDGIETEQRRRRAEASLRESEERFRDVFESANVGKSITRPTGEVSVNRAFADMLGYSREELSAATWRDITPPEDIAATQALLDSHP